MPALQKMKMHIQPPPLANKTKQKQKIQNQTKPKQKTNKKTKLNVSFVGL